MEHKASTGPLAAANFVSTLIKNQISDKRRLIQVCYTSMKLALDETSEAPSFGTFHEATGFHRDIDAAERELDFYSDIPSYDQSNTDAEKAEHWITRVFQRFDLKIKDLEHRLVAVTTAQNLSLGDLERLRNEHRVYSTNLLTISTEMARFKN